MRAYKFAVFTLVAFALGSSPVWAQDSRPVQVTPYLALGSAAASPVGVAVTFPVTSKLSVETDVAYRRGEGNINALSSNASLLFSLPRAGKSTPYLAAGVGLMQFGAPILTSKGLGTQSSVAMTMNAGAGLKMLINERLELRTDARWFKSFGRYGSDQFRVAQGISFGAGKR